MKRKYLLLILAIVAIVLLFGNPGEEQYLQRVASDFGNIHHGMSLSTAQLATMGESVYHQYLFASSYDYSFGNIQVSYFGIAFIKIYLGSTKRTTTQPNHLKTT